MNAFHQNLLRMISSGASLKFLLIYHKHYRSLNSTRSFNRILALAIRQNKSRIAQDLFNEMQDRGVYHNVESRKLRTRMLVQQGCWYEAWELESAQGEILLPIWLEFLDIPQRSTVRTMQIPREGMAPELLPAKLVPPSTHVARFRLLLRNFPKIDSGQLAAMPPRTVYVIVRWMLRMHYRQPALDITTLYFRQLPQTINSSLHNLCLRIIHLHMLPGWKRGLSAHYIARRTLNTFLGMHPSFRPNPTTLFLLLRTLRSSKYCGTLAHQVVEEFKTRWGSSVIDGMVQQRVASLAIKEGRLDIASSCLHALDQHRHVLDETSYSRRGTEDREWKLLNGRLERLRKRREGASHQQQQEIPRQGIT
ncbi:hypothetical protein PHLCEN_2v10922 [Hermanssonia centrifuga]|uniref:Pentatricopeptide repeat-containing protein n=1 Tax=Hermanssonia centrifuga TaxID=98765 RepID=A0A2R6NLE3_9APHY|nr:hypothetical protein PHLCEN_2v10922 [Hermanssonia centrifuga]